MIRKPSFTSMSDLEIERLKQENKRLKDLIIKIEKDIIIYKNISNLKV